MHGAVCPRHRAVGRDRARVGDASDPEAPRGLEHIDRADDFTSPRDGIGLAERHRSAARWMTRRDQRFEGLDDHPALGDVAGAPPDFFQIGLVDEQARRRLSSDKSSRAAGTRRARGARAPAADQPPAPVTTTGRESSRDRSKKRSSIESPDATVGAANLPSPFRNFPKNAAPRQIEHSHGIGDPERGAQELRLDEVVHGVDIGVEDGEFCVLVALRAAASLRSCGDRGWRKFPAAGSRSANASSTASRRRSGTSRCVQNYALYPHMSGYDNMAFSLKLAGESREQTRVRVEEAAMILG